MDRLKATSQIVDNLFKSMKKKKQAYGLSFVSSIVNEFIKTISSRFIYLFIYLRKDFKCTKTQIKRKPTNKTKIRTKNNKGNNFGRTKTSKKVKIV